VTRAIRDYVASPSELAPIAKRVLSANWTEGMRGGTRYAYTRPSPGRYPWQWYWDSCFAAIVWRRFDPDRSRTELESLLGACSDDGFVGHTIFWDHPVSLTRRVFYNVESRRAAMTSTIQPPLLAWAWRIAVGDPAREPAIVAHHRWLRDHRDLEGDGLLWLVQPDESGLDSSPKFDPVWGWRAHARVGFPLLVARNRRLGWDAGRIRDAGGPVVCEVVTNVLWGLSRLAMGEPSITPALVERLWDERLGMFCDEAQGTRFGGGGNVGGRRGDRQSERGGGVGGGGAGDEGARAGSSGDAGGTGGDDRLGVMRPTVETWAALAPLALPDLPESIGRRLADEHLLDRERFWLPVAPPSVSAAEPTFEPGNGRSPFRRYWRGPTWVNAAWLLWIGMNRLGYSDQAARMAEALTQTIRREGLREYYHPRTGAGLGATDFAWTALAVEMAHPDPTAARSYL
jgi:Mannosylglycerate hydrolase MGH1-like glycoside hydrolase domain